MPSYRAVVWSPRDQKVVRGPWVRGDRAAAKGWRDDARSAARKGALRPPTPTTLRQAGEALIAGARDGSVLTRSGDRFKDSTIHTYQEALRLRVLPALGATRLTDVRRADLQDLVDRLLGEGLDPSTIRNTLMPLRVIFRRAVLRDEVAINPTHGLELPAVRGRRDRIASPAEAVTLLAALPAIERALWATALYAGLRAGELQALAWSDVMLAGAGGLLRIERSWDPRERCVIAPKSAAGLRTVPVNRRLRDQLADHERLTGRTTGLVFGRTADVPFNLSTAHRRAKAAWRDAALRPIGLHECRHTFASLMIAAGVNAKALSVAMGHASVTITYDRYGHLMPGSEAESAGLLDAYLDLANAPASSPATL